MSEALPDPFIRYEYPKLLDESREAVAKFINAPVEGVVFMSNATVGANTVFKNIKWNPDGKDVAITFSTVYEACGKAIDFFVDMTEGGLSHRQIEVIYPLEDDEIIQMFRDTVKAIEAEGKRARICMFDVVSSRPGLLFPWKQMVKVCKELGILSMVDGAQGVGQVPLDLTAVDPDFFVSNCHKWMFVPRGCAVFYVPERNHHLLPATLATSHGYVSTSRVCETNPLPPSGKSRFITNFEFVGTLDNSPYLCVKDAIAWIENVLGGQEALLDYLWNLNKTGSEVVAKALGTHVLENKAGTLTNNAMGNVALPIWVEEKGAGAKDSDVVLSKEEWNKAFNWMLVTMKDEYKTFLSMFVHDGRFWVRISAQVYLELDDYEWLAGIVNELCERVKKGEFKA
jgi:selenocysteine lyase/cysteine desulfurase